MRIMKLLLAICATSILFLFATTVQAADETCDKSKCEASFGKQASEEGAREKCEAADAKKIACYDPCCTVATTRIGQGETEGCSDVTEGGGKTTPIEGAAQTADPAASTK
ncbi:MAG: hypothetical protein A2504_10685 [Bdellovibrionales bacterium RIFOXYD12_FULL_39_22]|nr:MAG: hypothetical protein A2385_14320 [Bdellovibrionales bacterium RIFOXYB1_FULL_39_21]OFZ40409.1 MAG: hypothetical protein A2485_03010 [Bdellovibrionales bacterium RIFOXYC12_FULL_39_17]OFZ49658.1 MAG: hypothetical protein A2404_09470 [Bdellovibrionales bacterium RIFOXYC1_FULL_39_130]OFZ73534.1 MAG: hypothetical protein A2451_15405 [Bdellovibrionales bacterium RIFOXYC2_FULL_39_8]OFZ77328.1 MAG: hypothetical protein A2560_06135 [Bdellovibrionales bacterium RIFOXYD1_FULL_39_84]OFZ95983.1 MAG: